MRKIIYYGEALRTVSPCFGETPMAGPDRPTVAWLEETYDRLQADRPDATPEEFTLYFMSVVLGRIEDAEAARRVRLDSMRYIVRSAAVLPPDYAPIIRDARKRLKEHARQDEAAPTPVARFVEAEKERLAAYWNTAPEQPAPEIAALRPPANSVARTGAGEMTECPAAPEQPRTRHRGKPITRYSRSPNALRDPSSGRAPRRLAPLLGAIGLGSGVLLTSFGILQLLSQ
ncbi:hypothetical protein [Pseudoruegeria sp. HB172150]|uniref:hypothetical protein n=1 Tax=Pseudoruegeria sp. HB172150 TaxID=2721164 RepID=UPI001555C880|nr:hypothetical protein [Pseudoruegeria sp. HB172150]